MNTTTEKAKETLVEAEIIRRQGCCSNSAANRYYFAVIQVAYDYAKRNNLPPNPYSKGGNHAYAQRIVKQNLPRNHRGTLSQLSGLRVKADYKPSSVISSDLNDPFIEKIKDLFEALEP